MGSASCLQVWQLWLVIVTLILLVDLRSSAVITNVSPGMGSSRREVEALIAFKESVTSDPSGALKGWHANDSDACSWKGVKCSTSSSNVADLDLRSLGLVGIVPRMIGSLHYLKYLDLSDNVLAGSIPESIANCSKLSYMNISHNQVSGDFPSEIGGLFQLQTLVASNNNFTGFVPDEIGNCSLLESLKLGTNFLEGPIPLTLGKLSRLKYLSLGETFISGTVPGALGNCSSLSTLNLDDLSQLGGELPQELSQLTKMQVFLLNYCNFVGTLPTWFINFTSLTDFELCGSSLYGEIPKEIGQLSKTLINLVLFKNQLTGPIPPAIVNCTSLYWLELHENQMTGDIPLDIGLLSGLDVLALANNNFTGIIPPSISNCSFLNWLELGFNPMSLQTIPSWISSQANLGLVFLPEMNLYGEIPSSLGQSPNLWRLDLFGNNFSGVLPTSLGNLSQLEVLQVYSCQLGGEIPSGIFGNLSYLQYLEFSDNSFVGPLPKFSNQDELDHLYVSNNFLTGEIDPDVGMGNPLLEGLLVGGNSLSGPLLTGIGNLSNLLLLDMSANNFYGSIPASWGNLTKLGALALQQNKVEGVIPVSLMSCTQLSELKLGANRFKGSIPHEIGQIVNLLTLDLGRNSLSGSLPSSLSNLTTLGTMDLSHNAFSGVIPGGMLLKMASSIIHLNVSQNFISGSWPPEFNGLVHLQYLDVSANMMSGPVLIGLANCIELTHLDFSFNNFTGAIPADLGLLQHLQFFNASFNNFEGPLPTSGLFLTSNITGDSFLGNPELCGSTRLVSQQCQSTSPPNHCKGFECRATWLPVAISMSIALLLGVIVITYCHVKRRLEKRQHDGVLREPVFRTRIALPEEELMAIINGGEDNVIGQGARSIVYKGELRGGEIIALKVFQNEGTFKHEVMDESASKELLKELNTLARLRHVNIIKVLGWCATTNVKALILEYMPRGSLYDFLYGVKGGCTLSHQERFKIILGVAESIVYLHHSFHEPIIHRDLKPSNILLGMDLDPKLADFGISKFATYEALGGEFEASASSMCGTFGYMAPECAVGYRISTKADVYSYGIVLLELLTGKRPAFESDYEEGGGLVEFVMQSFKERPLQLLDPTLMNEGMVNPITKDQLMLLLRVGLLCTRPTPSARPDMNIVLEMLKQIRDLGSESVSVKSTEELVNEVTIWQPQLHHAGMASSSS